MTEQSLWHLGGGYICGAQSTENPSGQKLDAGSRQAVMTVRMGQQL